MVPRLIDRRIVEAVIRPQIDDAHRLVRQRPSDIHGVPRRHADEYEIAVLSDPVQIREALQRQIIESAKLRKEILDLLPGVTFRCDVHHFRLRMPR